MTSDNETEYVRAVFCSYTRRVDGLSPEEQFDAWLAGVKAEAWDECVAVFDAKYFGGPTKDMVLGWLTNPFRGSDQ